MLGNLIKKASLDSPGEDFTSQIMEQIRASVTVETIFQQPLISSKMWIIIGFALATLIGTVFIIDFSFLGGIFDGITMDQPKVVNFFTSMLNSVGQWFAGVKLSSVTAMLLISIGLLILIERLLRKPKATNTLMV